MPDPFMERLAGLTEEGVLLIGRLQEEIVHPWSEEVAGNLDVVITGRQRLHFLERHPGTRRLEALLAHTVLDPDEVHRNRSDPDIAIFFRRVDEQHFTRAAVRMQQDVSDKKHSVLSFRLAYARDVIRWRERSVWRKGE